MRSRQLMAPRRPANLHPTKNKTTTKHPPTLLNPIRSCCCYLFGVSFGCNMPRQTCKQMVLSTIYLRIMGTFQLYCLLPLRDRKILEKNLEVLVFMYCELAQKCYVSQRSQRCQPMNKFGIDLMHTDIINPEVPCFSTDTEWPNWHSGGLSGQLKITHVSATNAALRNNQLHIQ